MTVVADDACVGVAGADSLAAEELFELLFPKPNFHFEGFFVIVGATVAGTGGRGAATATGVTGAPEAARGDETLPDLDVLLSSLASALTRFSMFWSCAAGNGVEGKADAEAAAAPLPFLAPRFLLLACDALLDPATDSGSCSCSCSCSGS